MLRECYSVARLLASGSDQSAGEGGENLTLPKSSPAGNLRGSERVALRRKTAANCGKALCRTRTDDPFLTMESR